MGKQTSYSPHRGPRQKQMSGSKEPGRNKSGDPLPEKAVGFPQDLGKSQPKNRSLGYRAVKDAVSKKGL